MELRKSSFGKDLLRPTPLKYSGSCSRYQAGSKKKTDKMPCSHGADTSGRGKTEHKLISKTYVISVISTVEKKQEERKKGGRTAI